MRRTAVVLATAVLAIGVACTPMPPPESVLAIAYTNHEVGVVFAADSNAIGVRDTNGAHYVFQVVEPIILGAVDIYQEEFPGAGKTLLSENDFLDSIEVDTQSPSAPDTPVVTGATDGGDQPIGSVDRPHTKPATRSSNPRCS